MFKYLNLEILEELKELNNNLLLAQKDNKDDFIK